MTGADTNEWMPGSHHPSFSAQTVRCHTLVLRRRTWSSDDAKLTVIQRHPHHNIKVRFRMAVELLVTTLLNLCALHKSICFCYSQPTPERLCQQISFGLRDVRWSLSSAHHAFSNPRKSSQKHQYRRRPSHTQECRPLISCDTHIVTVLVDGISNFVHDDSHDRRSEPQGKERQLSSASAPNSRQPRSATYDSKHQVHQRTQSAAR